MKDKIGVIGSGQVARVLANGFLKHGYRVMMGSRDVSKLTDWKNTGGEAASAGSFADAARFGDIVVLAVTGTKALEALQMAGVENLSGKTVIDVNNPIADGPPVNGVLPYFTGQNESLLETLQQATPLAHLVKAFSCVGNAFFVNPSFPDGKPTMFICGNNTGAKKEVVEILDKFGWEIADMGMMEAARAIEPLCMLWCIPGMLRNEWAHAFKLMKM
ncbi:MAG: NAD(P)-binding domain-containing protein [Bacteroidetes bacterium]|nr:NAD(P)-binding domain-containing protein [Bacteroidota bacterium]